MMRPAAYSSLAIGGRDVGETSDAAIAGQGLKRHCVILLEKGGSPPRAPRCEAPELSPGLKLKLKLKLTNFRNSRSGGNFAPSDSRPTDPYDLLPLTSKG